MKKLADLIRSMGLDDDCIPQVLGGFDVPEHFENRSAPAAVELEIRPAQWKSWNVPSKTIELLEHPERMRNTDAMRAAREIEAQHASGKIWGLIAGGMGSGKSTAAGAWLVSVRASAGTGRAFVASADIAALPLGTVHSEQRIDKLAECSALVIDDVGVRDGTRSDDGRIVLHPTVQRVLTRRYDARRRTLCTTNLVREQWRAYLDDPRLIDRWVEVGVSRVVRETSLRGAGEP